WVSLGRDEEAPLDSVRDAMLRLSERYGDRLPEEFPPLFQRILQNAIRDWFRRQKVRSTWPTLISARAPGRVEEDDQDPLDTLQEAGDANREESPQAKLERSQVIEI